MPNKVIIKGFIMTINKFGTKIPQNAKEYKELYDTFQIVFIPMKDPIVGKVEVATFDVVHMLGMGYELYKYNQK